MGVFLVICIELCKEENGFWFEIWSFENWTLGGGGWCFGDIMRKDSEILSIGAEIWMWDIEMRGFVMEEMMKSMLRRKEVEGLIDQF